MVTRYNLGYGAAGANPMISRLPTTQMQTNQFAQPVQPVQTTAQTPSWQAARQQNQQLQTQYRKDTQSANRQYGQAMNQYRSDLNAYNNQDFTALGNQSPQQYGGLLGSDGQIVNRAVYDPNDPNSMATYQAQNAIGGANIGQYLVNRNGVQGLSSTNLTMPTAPTRQTVQAPQMQDWKSMMPDRVNNRPNRDFRPNRRMNNGAGLLGGANMPPTTPQPFNPQANNELMVRLQGASDFGAGNLGIWRNGALAGSSYGYDLANNANNIGMSASDYDKMINPDTYQNRWGADGQWIGNREGSTTQSPFTAAQMAMLQGSPTYLNPANPTASNASGADNEMQKAITFYGGQIAPRNTDYQSQNNMNDLLRDFEQFNFRR